MGNAGHLTFSWGGATAATACIRSIVIPLKVHSVTSQVSVSDVARPNTEKRVRGEGMPISKTPGQKGDLRIRFDVQFPHTLTDSQKAGLRKLLPSS